MILRRLLFWIIIIPFTILKDFLIYSTITDYSPRPKETIYTSSSKPLQDSLTFSLLSWNIGYCGMNSEMDFFYDGGVNVRTTKEQTLKNLTAIKYFLSQNDTVDFFLLQEADLDSKRSWHIREFESLKKQLTSYHPFLAKNYDVSFVPVPLTNPMGSVTSGIVTFSRYNPSSVTRFAFPGEFPWPTRLFELDRCFMVCRFPLTSGKELLVINTHNSAFDDGSIRKEQMKFLKTFLLTEFEKGNFLVIGGDWNQCPPGISPNAFSNDLSGSGFNVIPVAGDFMPEGWTWLYDKTIPSNRYLDKPFVPGSKTTILDFFLLSPNVNGISAKTVNLGFRNSDHEPVIVSIQLQQKD
jgi:endonuclease/exonuclease/phosphatase family metal-dependent hydrolase